VTAPHLPHDAPLPAVPRGVVPLGIDVGTVAGQRLVLLSLERWDGWADLRFARIDVGATARLTRRVPPPGAWRITVEDRDLEVFDAVGRGDRTFSNGEVRLVPSPPDGATLTVEVTVVPGTPPLEASVTLPHTAPDEA
jgi:hypothetical protein